jgi:hypothetical protein
LDGRLQNLRTNSDVTLQQESPLKICAFDLHRTVEFFCWTPG